MMGTVRAQLKLLYPYGDGYSSQENGANMAARSADTKVDHLAGRLRKAIEQGAMPAGSRLRSVRDAARKEGLGINTVVEAYNRLVARGYAESRPGSGYYVREIPCPRASAPAPHVTAAVDVVSLLR